MNRPKERKKSPERPVREVKPVANPAETRPRFDEYRDSWNPPPQGAREAGLTNDEDTWDENDFEDLEAFEEEWEDLARGDEFSKTPTPAQDNKKNKKDYI